ncbi:hypothetical protein NUSPORA_01621 [Nucleospora cyclopteri]
MVIFYFILIFHSCTMQRHNKIKKKTKSTTLINKIDSLLSSSQEKRFCEISLAEREFPRLLPSYKPSDQKQPEEIVTEIVNVNPSNLNFAENKKITKNEETPSQCCKCCIKKPESKKEQIENSTIYIRQNKPLLIDGKIQSETEKFTDSLKNLPDFIKLISFEYQDKYKKYEEISKEFNKQLEIIKDIHEKLELKQNSYSKLENEFSGIKSENNALKHELEAFKLYKNEIVPYVETIKSNLSQKDDFIEKLTVENNEIKVNLTKNQMKFDLLEQEADQKSKKLKTLLSDKKVILTRMEDLRENLAYVKKSITDPAIHQIYRENQKLLLENEIVFKKTKFIQNNCSSLLSEIFIVKKDVFQAGRKFEEFENKINELNKIIKMRNEEKSVLEEEKWMVKEKLIKIKGEFNDIIQIKEELKAECDEISKFDWRTVCHKLLFNQKKQFEAQRKNYESKIKELNEKIKVEGEKRKENMHFL